MSKYVPFTSIDLSDRTWPQKRIEKHPIWCSVDLRDGNQALANPMNPQQKMRFFSLLISMGFKEIEVSFPSASKTDYDFTRMLIEENHIPEDCTIQILTQARNHLIEKSFEALSGCKRVIVHLYNSTSPAQRDIVFKKSRKEIIDLATDATKRIRDLSTKFDGEIILEYSPESFSQTEVDFATDICNAVFDTWQPASHEKVIINLPSTVEVTTPNVFADYIEYVGRNLHHREQIILSVHTHNDRGCAVAAAEMAQLAGADRVEGTLFGNGERTGNTDLITLALNLYSQGIDPGINILDMQQICDIYQTCTGMPVHPRHPYAGELVFTAFSGSHQDAISKGLAHYNSNNVPWNVPYLPIDPSDIGRSYDAVIRINSQSGKGGAAYIMESVFGFQIPKIMHEALGAAVKREADSKVRELTNSEVNECFQREFLNCKGPYSINNFSVIPPVQNISAVEDQKQKISISAEIVVNSQVQNIKGSGNGIIDALINALKESGVSISVKSFHEHSIAEGSDAKAVAYISIQDQNSHIYHGAGIDTDITSASLKAIINALNKMHNTI